MRLAEHLAVLAATGAATAAASKTPCDASCSLLAAALGDKVTATPFPSGTFWSLQEAALAPACIVRPLSAQDASQAVAILTGPQGGSCQFAIKGGGHAPAAGFANIQGGVTLDMAGLKATTLNEDKSVVSVGAGALWNDVYGYLDSFNLSAAGGRNGLVGVGGLLVGGGISHFSPRVGWACDGVVAFEVVLANGSLANATQTTNADLYRALKGGAANFGLVTRYDLATFPQGDVSVTSLVNDAAQVGAVFKAFTAIAAAPEFDPYVSLVAGLLYNSTSRAWLVSTSAVYTQPVLHPAAFAELVSVPAVSSSSSLMSVAALANENPTPPLNWLFATGTFGTSSDLMDDIFRILNETLFSFDPAGGGIVWNIAFEPLPSAILSHAGTRGGNALGLGPEDGDSFVVLFSALWSNSAANSAVDQVARQAVAAVRAHAQAEGLLRTFEYLNYAGPHQTPLASYGAESFGFLAGVSRKYDPEGVFQRKVPGGFKLW